MNLSASLVQKQKTLAEWTQLNPVLKQGEIAIAVIENPAQESAFNASLPNSIGMKIGDGTKTFTQLAWTKAPASDVYSWAKAQTKPAYSMTEISDYQDYVGEEITFENTWIQQKATGYSNWNTNNNNFRNLFTATDNCPIDSIFFNISVIQRGSGTPSATNNRPFNVSTDTTGYGVTTLPIMHTGKNLCEVQPQQPAVATGYATLIPERRIPYTNVTLSLTFKNAVCQYPESDFINFYNIYSPGSTYIKTSQLKRVDDDSPMPAAGAKINGRYYYNFTGTCTRVLLYCLKDTYGQWSGNISDVQIEYDGVATEYEEHRSEIKTYQIPYPGIFHGVARINDKEAIIESDADFKIVRSSNEWELVDDGSTVHNLFRVKNPITTTGISPVYSVMSDSFQNYNGSVPILISDTTLKNIPAGKCFYLKEITSSGFTQQFIAITAKTAITTTAKLISKYGSVSFIYGKIGSSQTQTYSFDPPEFTTFFGTNILHAGCWYDALQGKYTLGKTVARNINSSSIAPVEKTAISSANYANGSLFIKDNNLYKATTSIASGEQLTEGVNCTPTMLVDEFDYKIGQSGGVHQTLDIVGGDWMTPNMGASQEVNGIMVDYWSPWGTSSVPYYWNLRRIPEINENTIAYMLGEHSSDIEIKVGEGVVYFKTDTQPIGDITVEFAYSNNSIDVGILNTSFAKASEFTSSVSALTRGMIAPVETEYASRAYDVGAMFIFGDNLVRVTTAIQPEDRIVLNENCVVTTLAEELARLNG